MRITMRSPTLLAAGALIFLAVVASLVRGTVLAANANDTASQLQRVLDTTARSHPGLGILTSVSAPSIGLNWNGAAGPNSREGGQPLRPNQTFRIASVTKVFVAAAIFRLVESGKVGLYDPIAEYISPETAKLLVSGGYDTRAIRVQHLLSHTSGLYDYAMDSAYQEAAGSDPRRRWTRLEQIEFAMNHGKRIGPPGKQYSYSDTGYVILGEIIERASGQSMAAYVRQSLAFRRLHLGSTYFETLEPTPNGIAPRMRQYFDDIDITDADPSADLYGGGGIVSDTRELNVFMRALFTGNLFQKPSTLPAALMSVIAAGTEKNGRGVMAYTVPFGSRTCWGHEGFWGVVTLYCPDLDLAVSSTMNVSMDDASRGLEALQAEFLEQLSKVVTPPVESQRH
jgi:D-alanyl-D-alanine carboxypeptidase